MLSLQLCVMAPVTFFLPSKSRLLQMNPTTMCPSFVLPAESAMQFNSEYSCLESFLSKQTQLETFRNGEEHGLTPVPWDATKGEVHGWVNY